MGLDYIEFKVVVLKCQWVESSSGVKEDENGCTLVDLTKIGHKSYSFICLLMPSKYFM